MYDNNYHTCHYFPQNLVGMPWQSFLHLILPRRGAVSKIFKSLQNKKLPLVILRRSPEDGPCSLFMYGIEKSDG